MLEGMLGADVFRAGIQAYLKMYQYKNADSNDLFDCLTSAAQQSMNLINVTQFMADWTQRPGYPLVNCSTSPSRDGMSWTCTQQRYYAYPVEHPTNYTWPLYLTAANNYAPFDTPHGLLWPGSESRHHFDVPSSTPYIKLNQNSTGFFHVMYDKYGWQQLSDALNSDGFGGLYHDDRLGVVLDAWEFSRRGRMSAATFLNLTRFLQYDTAVRQTDSYAHTQACCYAGRSRC